MTRDVKECIKMSEMRISENSSSEEIIPFAKMVHELFSLPVTMRSKNKKGVRMEQGRIIDRDYTGPVLEEALKKNAVIHTIPAEGVYKGIPVVVAPVHDRNGHTVAVIGIVDVVCTIDLASVFGNYPQIVRQVEESKKDR